MKVCEKCGEKIETEIAVLGIKKIVPCMCNCRKKELEEIKKRLDFDEEMQKIKKLRQNSMLLNPDATFANAKITPANAKIIQFCKNYILDFRKNFSTGQGIILYGPCGTGKSYMAAAVANTLLMQKKSVVMTSFVQILQNINFLEDEQNIYALKKSKLLILDDLGAERNSDYATEKIFAVIDARYRQKKPFIITTNTDIKTMTTCTDIRYKRIYDRILEVCTPVFLGGESFRKKVVV